LPGFKLIVFNVFQLAEIIILSKLEWNTSYLTAADFLEHTLARMTLPKGEGNTIRKHAHAILQMCSPGKIPAYFKILRFSFIHPLFLQTFFANFKASMKLYNLFQILECD